MLHNVAIPDSLVRFVTITAPYTLLVYRYETMGSKEAVGQGHFRVPKYNRANHIALNVPYTTGLVSFVLIWVSKGTTY